MPCHHEHSATRRANTRLVLLSDLHIVWVQVASGAAELYAEEVQQIGSLTPQGTQQLLADLEYFCNVLAALGVALPPTLTTWQVLPGMQKERLLFIVYASTHHSSTRKQPWVTGWVLSLQKLHGDTLRNPYGGLLPKQPSKTSIQFIRGRLKEAGLFGLHHPPPPPPPPLLTLLVFESS